MSTSTDVLPRGDLPVRGLTVVHSPDARQVGGRIELSRSLCIGRVEAPDVDLVVRDARMSRRHATIQRTPRGTWEILDHVSHNGTFLDGQPCGRAPLAEGAVIRLGDTVTVFGRLGPGREGHDDEPDLVWESAALGEALRRVDPVAPSDLPVLLQGETGTGKERLARHIHRLSGRPGPYLAINCGSIPAGLAESYLFGHVRGAFTGATSDMPGSFEAARGGTLLLDEIGLLSLDQQPKLLRVLEEREFRPVGATRSRTADVRVLAATNADLAAEVASGSFRADLYARLAGLVVRIPPLRERRVDIPVLLRHFLAKHAPERSWTWSATFLENLLLHPWPRNVRQLRDLVRRITLHWVDDDYLSARHFQAVSDDLAAHAPAAPEPAASASGTPNDPTPLPPRARPSRDALVSRLQAARGNVSHVAVHYRRNAKQVYRWLAYYAIDPDDFRPGGRSR